MTEEEFWKGYVTQEPVSWKSDSVGLTLKDFLDAVEISRELRETIIRQHLEIRLLIATVPTVEACCFVFRYLDAMKLPFDDDIRHAIWERIDQLIGEPDDD